MENVRSAVVVQGGNHETAEARNPQITESYKKVLKKWVASFDVDACSTHTISLYKYFIKLNFAANAI
jgi:hypothetical protein